MDRSYIIYILIYIIFHFKHDVLITEKPLRGVFNKVLSYLILSSSSNAPLGMVAGEERLVRFVKEPLRKVLGKALLSYPELATVLTRI